MTAPGPHVAAARAHVDELVDPSLVGYKFARQEILRRQGLPVPSLRCLTADVFDHAVTPVRERVTDERLRRGDLTGWADLMRAEVSALQLDRAVTSAVLAAFDEVAGPEGLVAVRACAIGSVGIGPDTSGPDECAEDGAADPFAGMTDSFLYVPRAQVLQRVVDCWASAFAVRAVAYRAARGVDPAGVRIAVAVQRMILGERSFVAFTRDPSDHSDKLVVAAAYGIGEGVVQEKADIDHFFVDRSTGAVRSEVSSKHRMLGIDPGSQEDCPAVRAVQTHLADHPVLTRADLRRIEALASQVEHHLGAGQDIEGTITADGSIHLVQARPITSPPPRRHVTWTNHNVTESFPGVSSALTFSQAKVFYQASFGDFYRRMGVRMDDPHHLHRLIGYLNGQVYYRLDAWHALHGRLPGFAALRPSWERSLGLQSPTVAIGSTGLLRALPVLIARWAINAVQVPRFFRWWDDLVAGHAVDENDVDQLVAVYRRLWAAVASRWGTTLVNSYLALAIMHTTSSLLQRWAPSADPALLTNLLSGGRENRSLSALRAAIAFGELFSASEAGMRALTNAKDQDDDRAVWESVIGGEFGTGIATAAAEYLRRYGDRAPNDLKLEAPTPRQQPWTVLRMVRPFLELELTVAASQSRERHTRALAEGELRRACRNPLRRAVLRLFAAGLRHTARVREDARFSRTQLYGLSRQILLAIAELLVQSGCLSSVDDIAHLTVEELLGAADGALPGADLSELVAIRQTEFTRCAAQSPLPAVLTTRADVPVLATMPRPTTETDENNSQMRGLPSSSGRVRAPAKIVLEPDIDPGQCRDRILVARETDPGWLFLMLAAKGIIVERGSMVSHTAITGRMLGIPTVVAVARATTRINDGDLVELDGDTGMVRIVPSAGTQ